MLVAFALVSTQFGFAQTHPPEKTRTLSLRECILMALTRNLDLEIVRMSVDVARFNLNGSYGAYVPTFSFSARHDFVSQPPDFDPKKANFDFPYELTSDSAGPALNGLLPIGLSYDLNAVAGEKKGRTDFRLNPDTAANFPPNGIRETNNFFADAGLSLQQHLLKDFWIDKYRQAILLRRKDLSISEQTLQFEVMKTVLAVELSYYDLISAREQVRVQQLALELKEQFVAETKRRVEVGDLPPLDSDQAESQLETTRTSLTAAREAYATRQNTLKRLLSDDFMDWAEVELQPGENLVALKMEVNRSESFLNALKNRPDLLQARLAVERSDVEVRFRKNQLFPNLDVIGHYGGLGIDESLGSAVSDSLHFRNPEYFYGAVVSFPLTNLRERNDYQATKSLRQIAVLQLRKAEQEVLLQVADYVNRVESRFTQTGSTRKARTYAEAALGAEQKKLQNGLSTSFFVLQLQETLTAARTAEVLALADYNKALAQLSFAEGTTLSQRNVRLEGKPQE
jgi:outer membrane protein TolC